MTQDAVYKEIIRKPAFAKGEGMTQVVRRVSLFQKSDLVDYDDTTTVNLFELPGTAFLKDIFVRVNTAFDASGTSAKANASISVTTDSGSYVLFDTAAMDLQSTGFKFTSVALPYTSPSSGGPIVLTYSPGTTTAGQLEVYIEYIENAENVL